MESVHDIITLTSSDTNDRILSQTMLQDKYPFQICNISLPQCNTGFVYFLISIPWQTFVYKEKRNCLQNRLWQHNSGYSSSSSTPTNFQPFAILGLICSFDINNDLMLFVEEKWKIERDRLFRNNIEDPYNLRNISWKV